MKIISKVFQNLTKHFIYGGVSRKRAVEDVELSLKALGYVITTAPWVYHGAQELYIYNM